jgi:hypothetical protein
MSVATQSLWPPDIRPGIQTPFAILQQQAEALTAQTEGLLVGEVKVLYNEDRSITSVTLDIVVPSLDNYRHRVLTVTHKTKLIYPVEVDAEMFHRTIADVMSRAVVVRGLTPRTPQLYEAASDGELRTLVQKVFESVEVKAAAISLIAKATEVQEQRQRHAEAQAQIGSLPGEEEPPPAAGENAPPK